MSKQQSRENRQIEIERKKIQELNRASQREFLKAYESAKKEGVILPPQIHEDAARTVKELGL